jgi:hypothetical protein
MVADTYDDYTTLKSAFVQTLGYRGRQEIPAELIRGLALFCDTHAGDGMMPFYAASLVNQFWRKRTAVRRDRFVHLVNARMESKSALLALLNYLGHGDPRWFGDDCCSMIPVWVAIRDLPDGYGKANDVHRFARFFREDELQAAYQCALAMPGAYRARALAGLYPCLDTEAQSRILSYLFTELGQQSWEASAQLRRLFPSLDQGLRTEVVGRYLATPSLREHDLAYFVIHNAQYLDPQDARAIATRLRGYDSEYLRIRSLLKLAAHFPEHEIRTLVDQFLSSFEERPASVELIHNLFHVSAHACLRRNDIVSMALRKIGQLDDGQNAMWSQKKYNMLSFLAPHLETGHQDAAFSIASHVKGGYRKSLLARLRRNLAASGHTFAFRPASIVY